MAPDRSRLALADNENESVIVADLDLSLATGKYAQESLQHPRFLSRHWERMLRDVRSRVRDSVRRFDLDF